MVLTESNDLAVKILSISKKYRLDIKKPVPQKGIPAVNGSRFDPEIVLIAPDLEGLGVIVKRAVYSKRISKGIYEIKNDMDLP